MTNNEWHYCKDCLPDTFRDVLIVDKDGCMIVGYYKKEWYDGNGDDILDVVAWTELPSLPWLSNDRRLNVNDVIKDNDGEKYIVTSILDIDGEKCFRCIDSYAISHIKTMQDYWIKTGETVDIIELLNKLKE